MFNADRYWITIAEVQGFIDAAGRVFTPAEWEALTSYLAMDPLVGTVIPDTSGVRMIKWPAKSQGRSGARVVYFFRDLNTPVYLLAIYEKGERVNLSAGEKTIIRLIVEEIVETYGLKWAIEIASSSGAA